MLKTYLKYYDGLSPKTWIGISACLIEATLVGIFSFMTVYFTTMLDISVIDAGKIISSYGMGTIIGAMLCGRLVDQFRPPLVAGICLLTQASCYLLLAHQHDTLPLMLVMFMSGIASYGFITANHTWTLGVTTPATRLKTINILDAASNLGFGVAGALISFIAMPYFPMIFTASGVLLIIPAFFMLHFRHDETHALPTNDSNSTEARLPPRHSLLLILSLLQKAFAESYQLKKYLPTIMQPAKYSFGETAKPVYYSLQKPSTHMFSPKSRKVSSTLFEMRELEHIVKIFTEEFTNSMNVCSDTILNRVAESVNFQYYHNEIDAQQIINPSADIEKFDDRFTSMYYPNCPGKLATDSKFLRGCVSIF